MRFKVFCIAAVFAIITAILTWRFGVALDAIQTTPVAGSHNLVTLGTRGGSGLLGGRIGGV